jgi:hypothetical protein
MPPKKAKKPRKPRVARSATEKKKGLKQKQKQKQVVNVQVSSGGGGGSGYIPIPQAPEINYSLLSQLLRPAATVDVPIRAQANPEPIAARAPVEEAIRPTFQVPVGVPSIKKKAPLRFAEGDAPVIESELIEGKSERSDKGKSRGSYKEKAISEGRNIQNIFALRAPSPSASESEGIQSGRNIRSISEYMPTLSGGGGGSFV